MVVFVYTIPLLPSLIMIWLFLWGMPLSTVNMRGHGRKTSVGEDVLMAAQAVCLWTLNQPCKEKRKNRKVHQHPPPISKGNRHWTDVTKGAGAVLICFLVSLCACACPGVPWWKDSCLLPCCIPALGWAHQALGECFSNRMIRTAVPCLRRRDCGYISLPL